MTNMYKAENCTKKNYWSVCLLAIVYTKKKCKSLLNSCKTETKSVSIERKMQIIVRFSAFKWKKFLFCCSKQTTKKESEIKLDGASAAAVGKEDGIKMLNKKRTFHNCFMVPMYFVLNIEFISWVLCTVALSNHSCFFFSYSSTFVHYQVRLN